MNKRRLRTAALFPIVVAYTAACLLAAWIWPEDADSLMSNPAEVWEQFGRYIKAGVTG